jgi:type II secretory pathway component PulJ
MRRAARPSRGGFTVIEALTAGIILVLAAGVLGRAVSLSMASLRLAKDTQRAAQLLDRTLTKIDMIGPQRMLEEGLLEGVFEGPDSRFSWSAEIESRLEGHLYDVTVEITWDADGGTRSVEAATRLNDPPLSRDQMLQWDEL